MVADDRFARPRAGRGSRSARGALGAALIAIGLLSAAAAHAGDPQEYQLGKTRVDRGEYEDAAARFAVMLSPKAPPCTQNMDNSGACRLSDSDLIHQARAQYAIALVALGREVEADAQILTLLSENPTFVPSPAVFPQAVVDRFTQVRGEHQATLDRLLREQAERERQARLAKIQSREDNKRWIEELERQAGEVRVVEKRSRWIAALPLGVGQFQNGEVALGATLLTGQVLAVAASIVTNVLVDSRTAVDPRLPDPSTGGKIDVDALNTEIQSLTIANRVSIGVAAGLAVIGVIQAQVAFVPERVRIEKRPLPKPPSASVAPTVAVDATGGSVGLVGSF